MGSRARALREALGLTQDEVSVLSVDDHGRVLRRIEVGYVESGRNMASTKRVRAALCRAFAASEEDLFDYLEGRTALQEFLKLRGGGNRTQRRRPPERKSPYERAIELVLSDGYGTAVEVRQAAAQAKGELSPEKQVRQSALEWANLIEASLRTMRLARDPTTSSRGVPRAQSQDLLISKATGRRSA